MNSISTTSLGITADMFEPVVDLATDLVAMAIVPAVTIIVAFATIPFLKRAWRQIKS